MSRVQSFGYSQMLDFTHRKIRYTLIIQNDKVAAYEATGMVASDKPPAVDPIEAARDAFSSSIDGEHFEVSDKWFINRWLELVEDTRTHRETPIEEAGDFG